MLAPKAVVARPPFVISRKAQTRRDLVHPADHGLPFGIGFVVETGQMEPTVNGQELKLFSERDSTSLGLLPRDLYADGNVADLARGE